MTYVPIYNGPMEPKYPCRELSTRHCPAIYGDVCGPRPCARFGEKSEAMIRALWLPEIEVKEK